MTKKTAILYMGGTFGCVGNPLAPMPFPEFSPKLQQYIQDEDLAYFCAPVIKDSSACTAQDWLKLVQSIQTLHAQGFERFVIIHGTDTMSYASAVLSHFLGYSATIILTGSQYPLLNIHGNALRECSDAMDNLRFALKSSRTAPHGVYLAFNHQLVHARSALKQHTTALNAFSGVDALDEFPQSMALMVNDEMIARSATFNCMSVMIQPIELEQQLKNLQQLLKNLPHFLILQGFGTGNIAVNYSLIELINTLYEQGCAVILTTQVPFGDTDQRYAVADWVKSSKVLINGGYGHADLYAKALKMYLQYDAVEQWHRHWVDE